MPVKTQIWTVNGQPHQLKECILPSEQLLEDMIISAPRVLSDEWMLIGRQERTGLGGRIDLLAIAPDTSLMLIELKRDRTPRDVVAQALDYASWVERLEAEDIAAIYKRFNIGADLATDFRKYFCLPLDEGCIQPEPSDYHRRLGAGRQYRTHRGLSQRARYCDQRAVFSGVPAW